MNEINEHKDLKKVTRISRIKQIFSPMILVLSIIIFLTATIFCIFLNKSVEGFMGDSNLQKITEGWTDKNGKTVSLPVEIKYTDDDIYILKTVLSSEFKSTEVLSMLFSAKYLNVRIFLDNEEICTCFCKPAGEEKTIGKAFMIKQLNDNLAGHELRIEAVPLLGKEMKYEINPPVIGSERWIIYDIIYSDISIIIIVGAIFCFGVFLLMFGYKAKRAHKGTFFQIGIFAVVFAIYSFFLTDTVHIIIGNSKLIYFMEFILLALAPLLLLLLVYSVCIPKFHKIMMVDIIAMFINFCLQTFVYVFTTVEIRKILWITHVLVAGSILLLIPVLTLSSKQGKERFRLLISFSPILIGAMWDLVRFYASGVYKKAVGFQLGVLLFIFMQTLYLIHSYFKYYQNHLETDLYRRMAYTDVLTGLANRAAFEDQIQELHENIEKYSQIWCVCADINDLKRINDEMGHSKGDELIRGAADVLSSVMCEQCRLYRTGGDEFVMFVIDQEEEILIEGFKRFDEKMKEYNNNHDAKLSIALGYDRFYKEKGDTITSLISRADTIMYENKRDKKRNDIVSNNI